MLARNRRRMPEKGPIIPIKRCVVAKSATLANRRGLFPVRQHFLREEKAFFQNVFFRCLMQLPLKHTKQIAFTHEKMLCDLLNCLNGAEVLVDIFECLGNQGGDGSGVGRQGAWKQGNVIKQFG